MNDKETKLGAQIILKNINAIINYVATNRKISDPKILLFLTDLEESNLLAKPNIERNANLYNLHLRSDIEKENYNPQHSSSNIIYDKLNRNLGYKKIMQVLGSDWSGHRLRVSVAYNCGNGLTIDPLLNMFTAACINPSCCKDVYEFNNQVYFNALKFLNELNYAGKTADEAEELEALLNELHAENETWLNTIFGTTATKR